MAAALWEHFRDGGAGMFPVAVCLFIIARIAIERAARVTRAGWGTARFRRLLRQCILSRDLNQAIALCDGQSTPVARAVRAGLAVAHESDAHIQLAIDGAALSEIPPLWRGTRSLVLLGNFAMYFGLYGAMCAIGSSTSTCGPESVDPSMKARWLAQQIGWALNCTAFGLFAAIVAVVCFGLLRFATERVEHNIVGTVVETMSLVSAHRSKLVLPAIEGERGVDVRTGHLRLPSGTNGPSHVSIACRWGDDVLGVFTWHPPVGRPSTLEIPELAGTPSTKLTLQSDGAGHVRWVFEQAACPASCAFGVDLEPGEKPPFEPRRPLMDVLRPRTERAFPRPRWGHRPALVLTALSFFVHAVVIATLASVMPALDATDAEMIRPDSPVFVRIPTSGPLGPLALVRVVQTPTHPDGSDFDCADVPLNCEFRAPAAIHGQSRPAVPETIFFNQAARFGPDERAGYAFHNWRSPGTGPVETTGLPRRHVVRAGETLRTIAGKYGLERWQCIYHLLINPNLVATRVDPDRIWPGDEIWIPLECRGSEPYAPLGKPESER
jgi:biopolymer transport protein ExbB/TolQ